MSCMESHLSPLILRGWKEQKEGRPRILRGSKGSGRNRSPRTPFPREGFSTGRFGQRRWPGPAALSLGLLTLTLHLCGGPRSPSGSRPIPQNQSAGFPAQVKQIFYLSSINSPFLLGPIGSEHQEKPGFKGVRLRVGGQPKRGPPPGWLPSHRQPPPTAHSPRTSESRRTLPERPGAAHLPPPPSQALPRAWQPVLKVHQYETLRQRLILFYLLMPRVFLGITSTQ